MNLPLIPVVPFLFLMIISILYVNIFADSGKAIIKRKNQAKNFSTNSFRKKFNDEAVKRVEFNKREKIEILCLNAGYDLSFSDYLLICSGIALILFFSCVLFLHNIPLGLITGFVGFSTPKQILSILKEKRSEKINIQCGPFMKMVIKRYEYTSDFEKSMINTVKEFHGVEPMFSELSKTVSEMAIGISIPEALDNLSRRTSNKYLGLLSDYYRIAYNLGTDEVRKKLLSQAYIQYEENRKMKSFLKQQISEPKRDCYIMVSSVPLFFIFGCFTINGYSDFMFNTLTGQITVSIILIILLFILLFINKVIGAPLEKMSKKTNNPSQRKDI